MGKHLLTKKLMGSDLRISCSHLGGNICEEAIDNVPQIMTKPKCFCLFP